MGWFQKALFIIAFVRWVSADMEEELRLVHEDKVVLSRYVYSTPKDLDRVFHPRSSGVVQSGGREPDLTYRQRASDGLGINAIRCRSH